MILKKFKNNYMPNYPQLTLTYLKGFFSYQTNNRDSLCRHCLDLPETFNFLCTCLFIGFGSKKYLIGAIYYTLG